MSSMETPDTLCIYSDSCSCGRVAYLQPPAATVSPDHRLHIVHPHLTCLTGSELMCVASSGII